MHCLIDVYIVYTKLHSCQLTANVYYLRLLNTSLLLLDELSPYVSSVLKVSQPRFSNSLYTYVILHLTVYIVHIPCKSASALKLSLIVKI